MFLLWFSCALPPDDAQPLTVFAASSLADVLPGIGQRFTAQTGQPVHFVFDASSRLAKQIESGAEADIFLSADTLWMDVAVENNLVDVSTRRELLGNSLVVVVPSASDAVPSDVRDLGDSRFDRIALAGENVPAGRYARASLRALGVWESLSVRIVGGNSVRTALRWVALGEVSAGIVYSTDAKAEPNVEVAFALPVDTHPPIVYVGAVTTRTHAPSVADDFLVFCHQQGRAEFEEAGFVMLP